MHRILVVGSRAPTARAVALADLVELRLDLGADRHVAAVQAASIAGGGLLLWTLRSVAEGGRFDGTPDEAAARLVEAAARVNTAWVDAEAEVVRRLRGRLPEGVRVLGSVHGPRGTGTSLPPVEGVDAWKVARPVASEDDLAAVLDEARDLARAYVLGRAPPATVVPYTPAAPRGTPGLASGLSFARVVVAAAASGAGIAPLVYGRDDADDDPDLAGVPSLSTLVDEGRLGEVSDRARVFALVGRPPSRSPSPRLHNAVFRALGVDAVYLPAIDLDPRVLSGRALAGVGVTTPYKEAARACCDEVDPLAARAGAVNTMVRRPGGGWYGRNTDVLGVRAALAPRGFTPTPEGGGSALVIGGGGYARAVAVALSDLGCEVRLVGGPRAQATAAALGVGWAGPDPQGTPDDRIWVNATPVGADGALPASFPALLDAAPPGIVVLDAPYAAGGAPGAWALAVRARGGDAVDGGELLVAQALAQAETFLGRGLSASVVGPVLSDVLRAGPSLVLVGPRSAGKTTVGRRVASRLGRPFIDTDDELARQAGRPAGRVLLEEGEPAFRRREARCVARARARRGAVIALGGGAVRFLNDPAPARSDAFVVRLAVAPETAVARMASDVTLRPPLGAGGDPLGEARAVAADREEAYAAAAHVTVPTDDATADAVVEAVLAVLHGPGGDAPFASP